MPQSVDIDLTSKDLAAVTSTDALAALLHKLGYPTDRRTSLESAALGLTDDSAVRKLELLSEDADQFLRIYFAQVKSVTAKVRNDMVRILGKLNQDHLVILTKDFTQLEFVLIVKVRHAKNLGEETGYKPIARTITIHRSSVDRTTLRILRRLTWTASDGLAQYDKLRSVFEAAAYSGEYFQNRALFADHYLTTRLKEDSAWANSPNKAFQQIRALIETAKPKVAQQDEKAARQNLFEPLFKTLGFTSKSNPVQASGEPVADYDLRDDSGALRAAALVYQWDRWLDGPDDRDLLTPSENPGAAVVSLLEQGSVSWVIVTNGRHWRLYSRAAHSRSTNFYEIELEEALQAGDGTDPNEAFRYFWLFFRVEAFQPNVIDAMSVWLDTIVQGSRDYAREVERELKKRVFERVVPFLAKGFLADRSKRLGIKKKPDEEELETIRQGTLTLLYRILFLLYAESRDLLPIRESPYFDLSLKKIEREIADHAGSAESVSDERITEHFAKDEDTIYLRLARLCATMDSGDAAVNVPTYNGGLFRTTLDKETARDRDAIIARFLHEHRVPDLYLATAIDHLARVPDPRQGFGLAFVDYKSLGVRQLGSIYEGLLEYRLFVAEADLVEVKEKSKITFKPLNEIPESNRTRRNLRIVHRGDVYLANDKAERKASGSYYTPENIVEYIVSHTVGPVLERKLDALAPEFRKAEKSYHRHLSNAKASAATVPKTKYERDKALDTPEKQRRYAANAAFDEHLDLVNKLFDLKVLDPAMGSGHFLVDAVDFVTDKLLVWLNQFRPFNPVLVMLDRTRRNILDSLTTQSINIDPDRLTDIHLLKRHVLKRCIYGVDLNPLATELAKVSLWLDAFTLGAPLSFLDHHLRVGNSLLGATFDDLQRLTSGSLFAIDYEPMMRAVRNVLVVSRLSDTTAAEVHESASKYNSARQALDGYRLVLDLIVAQHFGQPNAPSLITEAGDLKLDSREHFLMQLNARDGEIVRQAECISAARRFFHWELEFPEIFFRYSEGSKQQVDKKRDVEAGFDCIVGNPPYVRQETLKADKAFLKSAYAPIFDSANDLYIYFMYQEINALNALGVMSMIVANKWLRAGYGEGIRRFLKHHARPISIIDFGHAPIFPDADTFPCVPLFARRIPPLEPPHTLPEDETWSVCAFPRENYDRDASIFPFVASNSSHVPTHLLSDEGWSLEDPRVQALMEKIRRAGRSLREHSKCDPLRGVLTGLNEAFVLDELSRQRLLDHHPQSANLIRPLLRGRDMRRWASTPSGAYLICIASSANRTWPWTNCTSNAETVFRNAYPAIYSHLLPYREKLIARADQGRFWWELRSCDYWEAFDGPKTVWQEMAWFNRFSIDRSNAILLNTAYLIQSTDWQTVAILNSPLAWWYMWRSAQHGKDEVIRLIREYAETFPVPELNRHLSQEIERRCKELASIPLDPAISARRIELEIEIAALVEDAFGLNRTERQLLKATMPPRDPISVLRRSEVIPAGIE